MTMQRTNDVFDFGGKVLNVQIVTSFNSNGEEIGSRVLFVYKGVSVNKKFKEYEDFQDVARKECGLIENLGAENYKIFSDNLSDMESLSREYIVVNNKVFDYYMKRNPVGNGQYYHFLGIDMTDGISFDGENPYPFFAQKERINKVKLLENLRQQVLHHFKDTGAEPNEKYLKTDLTAEYQEKLKENKKMLEA